MNESNPFLNLIAHKELGTQFLLEGKKNQAKEAFLNALSLPSRVLDLGIKQVHEILLEKAYIANILANLFIEEGEVSLAIPYFLTAHKFNPREIQYEIDFAYALRFVTFHSADSELQQAILSLFKQEGIAHQLLANAGFSLLKTLDIHDPLLLILLEEAIVPSLIFERFLTEMRKEILMKAVDLTKEEIAFLSSLSIQCHLNEYIFWTTPEEERALKNLTQYSALIQACYFPPTQPIPGLHKLNQMCFEAKQQEASIKKSIPCLSEVKDVISEAVQAQYEENPYPRWTTTNIKKPSLEKIPKLPSEPRSVLVAGCGTGMQAIKAAQNYKYAKIMAIDLSLASLAYAKRKSQEMGFDNIQYIQGDLLDLEKLGVTFDLIECVGVLHHMNDPLLGWKTLYRVLNPGGLMNIGFYSQIGRQDVHAAKKWIAENGWSATTQGIKLCRKAIGELHDENPIKKVTHCLDFFSLSMCRDLLFHVHESCFTLRDIQRMLDQLELSFIQFDLPSPLILPKYFECFPEDLDARNLTNWSLFEEKYPNTFAGMYQFWALKNASFE